MKWRQLVTILAAFTLFAHTSRAQETNQNKTISPDDLMRGMRAAYAAAKSYADTGEVEIVVSLSGKEQRTTKPFSIKFQEPSLIRIEWTDTFGGVPTPYILWSGANGTYKYASRMNQLGKKYDSLEQAIASQSGSSGGSTTYIPDLLLKVLKTPTLSDLADLKYLGEEKVDGVVCHMISGNRKANEMQIWIGKADFLIRKIRTKTQFAESTERHQSIILNGVLNATEVTFTPPADVENVQSFDPNKNLR